MPTVIPYGLTPFKVVGQWLSLSTRFQIPMPSQNGRPFQGSIHIGVCAIYSCENGRQFGIGIMVRRPQPPKLDKVKAVHAHRLQLTHATLTSVALLEPFISLSCHTIILMEPAGITAILTLVQQVHSYIKEAYNADDERKQLHDEITSTQDLLEQLNEKSEQAKWGDTLTVLATPHGPLQQLETTLKRLEKDLRPSDSRLKTMAKTLKWPLHKKDTESLVSSLERSKSLLTLALQRDLM